MHAIAAEHAPATFSSSLGAEDMVLTDAILRNGIAIEIFTLDTGRLNPETLSVLDLVRERYGHEIRVYRPDQAEVDRYVRDHGLDAIYDSVELRSRCCHIRKVEPLNRALAGKAAWVTGMRRAQSVTRKSMPLQEFDAGLWTVEVQSAGGVERARGVGLRPRLSGALQPVARPGLPQHRMRSLHACHRRGRGPARGPLVVGEPGKQGMWIAQASD